MMNIDQNSQTPIYDQIKLGLKGLVKKGLLRPGEPAPSIRKMAGDLKVNPNTVARAYRELTTEGVFEGSRGQENVISAKAAALAGATAKETAAGLETAFSAALRNGFTWVEIDAMITAIRRKLK